MTAPERIWAWDETGETCELMGHKEGEWTTEDCADMGMAATEHDHRADLHDATERKLAKAVAALRWQADQPEAHPFMAMQARAVLAEIEKGGV